MPYRIPNTPLEPLPPLVLPHHDWCEVADLLALLADCWGENPAELDRERLIEADRYFRAAAQITQQQLHALPPEAAE